MDRANITLRVKILRPGAKPPVQMSEGASGFDLYALLDVDYKILSPGQRMVVPTGLAFAVPPGYEGQVRPRSGLAKNNGLTVLNTPGTLDFDYRGEVDVILINLGDEPFHVKNGERIAQLVITPVPYVTIEKVDELDVTARATRGFGSTGVQ
jgi:dUTP pyrophosphatase